MLESWIVVGPDQRLGRTVFFVVGCEEICTLTRTVERRFNGVDQNRLRRLRNGLGRRLGVARMLPRVVLRKRDGQGTQQQYCTDGGKPHSCLFHMQSTSMSASDVYAIALCRHSRSTPVLKLRA